MADLPSNVTYGTIIGKVVLVIADTSGDANAHPDAVPAIGNVRFSPDFTLAKDTTSSPNVIIIPEDIVVVLDENGLICNPGDPSVKLVELVANDNPNLSPANSTYTVSFELQGVSGIPPFSISVSGGVTQDLAQFIPVPSSGGYGLPQAEAAAAAAAASAAAAAASLALGGGVDAEVVRSIMAATLVASGAVTVVANDAANTITIGSAATSGSSDAFLLARANHTGFQLAATISDLTAVVSALVTAQVATALVGGTVRMIGEIGGVYRLTATSAVGRPAGDSPWIFVGPDQPTNDGSITGGGGMVPNGTLSNGLVDMWVHP